MAIVDEIRKLLSEGKLLVGTKSVKKALNANKVSKIFVSSNAPALVKSEVNHLAKIGGIEVVHLEETNAAVGVICRKPFSVSLLGVKA